MNYQNPLVPKTPPQSEYEYAAVAEQDRRLQADPELAAGEGRTGLIGISIYFAAMVFFVCLVLYGLNHQREEGPATASSTAPAENAPPPPAPQQPNSQQGNPGAQQQAQPKQDQNAQPPTEQGQPNAQQQNPQQPAQSPQQNQPPAGQAPAPKQ